MSTIHKSDRSKNQFEVLTHFFKVRDAVTALLFRSFGYDEMKYLKKMEKRFSGKSKEELSEDELHRYEIENRRNVEAYSWFVPRMRDKVLDTLMTIQSHIFYANSTYPTCIQELQERRLYQNQAIAALYTLLQQLQYVTEVLPVDMNKFLPLANEIKAEIDLVKGWRKSNSKFEKNLRATANSATNFANANNNGNANYNNASNENGVRP